MTTTKIADLTRANVAALERRFDPELVELTATTATFDGDPQTALGRVEWVIAALPKCSDRHSLHAVRRKLARQVEGGRA